MSNDGIFVFRMLLVKENGGDPNTSDDAGVDNQDDVRLSVTICVHLYLTNYTEIYPLLSSKNGFSKSSCAKCFHKSGHSTTGKIHWT